MMNRLFSIGLAIVGLALGAMLVLYVTSSGLTFFDTPAQTITDSAPQAALKSPVSPPPAVEETNEVNAPAEEERREKAAQEQETPTNVRQDADAPGAVAEGRSPAEAGAETLAQETPTLNEVVSGSRDLPAMADKAVARQEETAKRREALSRKDFAEIIDRYLGVLETE